MECITIKIPLKDICAENMFNIITKTVNDINRVLEIAYPLMRSFILAVIEGKFIDDKSLAVPIIDERFVYAFLGISAFGVSNIKNTILKNDITRYYDYFCTKVDIEPNNLKNVAFILNQSSIEIYRTIITNIKCHFEKYIWKFIRYSFHKKYEEAKTNKTLKEYMKKLNNIKNYLLSADNSKIELSNKYQKWIDKYKTYLLPTSYTYMTFESDIVDNTFQYLKSMHYVCKFLQKYGHKSLQFFPLKKSVDRSHIIINTNALVSIFNQSKMKLDNDTIKQNIWLKYFKLTDNNGNFKYKRKDYSFNYQISTNGYCVSLNFIKNSSIEKQAQKKAYFAKSHSENKQAKSTMSQEEYNIWHNNKMKTTKSKDKKYKQDQKIKKEGFKSKIKKPVAEEIDERNNKLEFPYIDKMNNISQEFKDQFEEGKVILCDPGKRSILYMISSNMVNNHNIFQNESGDNYGVTNYKGKKILNYTSGTRSTLTKNKKYTKIRERWKDKITDNENWEDKTFKDIEKELLKFNSKSCNYRDFMRYVKKKFELLDKVKQKYDIRKLEKLKWYSYLNMIKHEKELIKNIKNEYGNDAIMVIGDWSKGNCIRYKPTPNIGFILK